MMMMIMINKTVPSDGNNHTEGNRKEKPVQRPRNTENVACENRSDPCSCWRAWYSKERDGGKHLESIKSSYCDRDSKDLHAGICANPDKGSLCVNRMID